MDLTKIFMKGSQAPIIDKDYLWTVLAKLSKKYIIVTDLGVKFFLIEKPREPLFLSDFVTGRNEYIDPIRLVNHLFRNRPEAAEEAIERIQYFYKLPCITFSIVSLKDYLEDLSGEDWFLIRNIEEGPVSSWKKGIFYCIETGGLLPNSSSAAFNKFKQKFSSGFLPWI